MKIELEIPEWAIGKHIYIFANEEILAIKEAKISKKDGEHILSYLPLKIKPEDGRCNGCGSCCSDGSPFSKNTILEMKKLLQTIKDYDNPCPFLTDKGCLLGTKIPFSCARSICSNYEECNEKMIEVE